MEYIHRYRGAHVFRDGQPCEVTDVVVAGPGKSGHVRVICRLRNMLTDACTEDINYYHYLLFKPEERTYRITDYTDEPRTLHLEDDLGVLNLPVGSAPIDQLLWGALQQGRERPAAVTVLVMKNPCPGEGEPAVFFRLTGAHLTKHGVKKHPKDV
jgi:hypothetical protein